jgi:DNA polymerase-1
LSSSNPNLLNLPRGYYGYDIRSLYKVSKGCVFITFDFSSCEVKILAALSGDEKMIDACRKGLDFHSFTASMMYNIPYEEMVEAVDDKNNPNHKKYKGFRQGAKAVTFD